MNGQGTFKWASGARYVGTWADGSQDGTGTFTWPNGASYFGGWRAGLRHGKGIYAPEGQLKKSKAMRAASRKTGQGAPPTALQQLLDGGEVSLDAVGLDALGLEALGHELAGAAPGDDSDGDDAADAVPLPAELPAVRPPGNVGEPGPVTPPSVSARLPHRTASQPLFPMPVTADQAGPAGAPMGGRAAKPRIRRQYYDSGRLKEDEELTSKKQLSPTETAQMTQAGLLAPKPGWLLQLPGAAGGDKLPGEKIYKTHSSYELMVHLQLGIRISVGKLNAVSAPRRLPAAEDFVEVIKMRFPAAGSQTTPPHASTDFKWKDYSPRIFRWMRDRFGVDASDYMLSLCGDEALRESGAGNSDCVLFFSHNARFIAKTMRAREMKVMRALLPKLYEHVRSCDFTFINRYFGLHRVTPYLGRNVRFLVMGNLFSSKTQLIHRKFDLKGSVLGRKAKAPKPGKDVPIYKDLDLDVAFRVSRADRQRILVQLRRDLDLLVASNVMDYSMLVGVHVRDPTTTDGAPSPGLASRRGSTPAVVDAGALSMGPVTPYKRSSSFSAGGSRPMAALDRSASMGRHKIATAVAAGGGSLHTAGGGGSTHDAPAADGDGGGGGGDGGDGTGYGPDEPRMGFRIAAQAVPMKVEVSPAGVISLVPPNTTLAAAAAASGVSPAGDSVVLHMGIIDILQEYNAGKLIEASWKNLLYRGKQSAVDPKTYAARLYALIETVFLVE